MNTEDKNHYDKAMRILNAALERRYTAMSEEFIKNGPDKLRESMGFDSEKDWEELFDYLITKQGVARKCVVNYLDFFSGLVAKKGPNALRKVFQLEKDKYDRDFEEIFDIAAVSTGSLYDYVEKNRVELAEKVKSGNSTNLRRDLGLIGKKYDGLWMEILDLMMNAVCDQYYDERTFEKGLMAISGFMNSLREHRSLRSYRKMWEFSEKAEA